MATTFSKVWKNKLPIPLGVSGSHQPVIDLGGTVGGTVTFGATNDVIKITTLPERITIGSNWALILGDHDSGAGLVLTLRINDGTTQKNIIHQSSAGQAGGIARPTKIATTEDAIGFTTNSKIWWLELLISTQAAGAQAAKALVQCDFSGFYMPGAVTE